MPVENTMEGTPPTEEETPIPSRPLSGGKSGAMPSWAEYMKQMEEEEAKNPAPKQETTTTPKITQTTKKTPAAKVNLFNLHIQEDIFKKIH